MIIIQENFVRICHLLLLLINIYIKLYLYFLQMQIQKFDYKIFLFKRDIS